MTALGLVLDAACAFYIEPFGRRRFRERHLALVCSRFGTLVRASTEAAVVLSVRPLAELQPDLEALRARGPWQHITRLAITAPPIPESVRAPFSSRTMPLTPRPRRPTRARTSRLSRTWSPSATRCHERRLTLYPPVRGVRRRSEAAMTELDRPEQIEIVLDFRSTPTAPSASSAARSPTSRPSARGRARSSSSSP
jgi:hypothetical protein